MTAREWMEKCLPMYVGSHYTDGVRGCPSDYNLIPDPEYCNSGSWHDCTKCWDRALPGYESEPKNTVVSKDVRFKLFLGSFSPTSELSTADEQVNAWLHEKPGIEVIDIRYQHANYGEHSILIVYKEVL